jgi:hypothetical protein
MILPEPGLANIAEESHPAATPEFKHSYFAYGMVIHSDVELPELQPFDSAVADLTFKCEALPRPMPEASQAVFEFAETNVYIGLGGIGQFSVSQPGLVTFEPSPGANPTLVNLVLLGSAMATVLHRRGLLTLHASGIDIGGRGAIFMGNKGAGKSTTAAAFISAGHRLLTDDVLPIDLSGDESPKILPGFPQLKLSEAAASSIVLPQSTMIPISDSGFYKSRLRLAGSFSSRTVSPAAFYVLARGDNFQATTLSGTDAMAALMANAYHARFGSQVFHGAAAAALMQQCAALARAVPVRVLRVPRDLDRLAELVSFVERDVA